jgi:phosphohistidine phosphatase
MRRLMLLRHAKSAWGEGVADRERPLAKRGREAAPRLGRYLADEQLWPDLVLVSPARRTQETWNLVRAELGEVLARSEPRIYEASAARLLDLVRETDDGVRTLLVIGHNPGLQDLARLTAGQGDRYALARMMQKYPTAGLAVIDFPEPAWRAVAARTGRLDRFVTPKSLGAGEDD